jgi:hypothetical protein
MIFNISSVTTLGTGSVKIIKFAEATQNESIHSNNISSSIDVESGVLLLVLMFLFLYISRVCSALWQNGETFLFHFGQYAESVPPEWKQSLENIGIGEPLVIYIQASKDFGMFDPLIIYKTILANAAATVTKLLVSEDAVATARASSRSSSSRNKKSNDDATDDEDDDTDDDTDDDEDEDTEDNDEDDKGTRDFEGAAHPLKRQAVGGGRNNNQFKSMNKTRLDKAHYALAKAQYNLNVFLEGKGQSSIPRTALRQEARNQTRLAFAKAFWKRENVRYETRRKREEKEVEDRYKGYQKKIQRTFYACYRSGSAIGFGPSAEDLEKLDDSIRELKREEYDCDEQLDWARFNEMKKINEAMQRSALGRAVVDALGLLDDVDYEVDDANFKKPNAKQYVSTAAAAACTWDLICSSLRKLLIPVSLQFVSLRKLLFPVSLKLLLYSFLFVFQFWSILAQIIFTDFIISLTYGRRRNRSARSAPPKKNPALHERLRDLIINKTIARCKKSTVLSKAQIEAEKRHSLWQAEKLQEQQKLDDCGPSKFARRAMKLERRAMARSEASANKKKDRQFNSDNNNNDNNNNADVNDGEKINRDNNKPSIPLVPFDDWNATNVPSAEACLISDDSSIDYNLRLSLKYKNIIFKLEAILVRDITSKQLFALIAQRLNIPVDSFSCKFGSRSILADNSLFSQFGYYC